MRAQSRDTTTWRIVIADDLPSSIAGIASLADCDIRHTPHQSQVHDGPDLS